VFGRGLLSLPFGAFAVEFGLEAIYPCPAPIERCACPPQLRTASPRYVARPRRARLLELPLTYSRNPVALVRDLIALVPDHIALVGHPVALICTTTPLFKLSSPAVEVGTVGSCRFRCSFSFSHRSGEVLCSRASTLSVKPRLELVGSAVAVIRDSLALVGDTLALVGDPVSFVRAALPLI